MARINRRTVLNVLNDLDNHNGVITHLEPDILECEVNWVLASITMNKVSKDRAEAEGIKKWQEYTEEPYKKGLNDLDNHNGVVTHLDSDILKCEVKWALGSITTESWWR